MIDPTLMLFDSHKEAIIFFAGFLAYIIGLSVLGYIQAASKDEKKDALAFLSVFDSMAVVSLTITGFLSKLS